MAAVSENTSLDTEGNDSIQTEKPIFNKRRENIRKRHKSSSGGSGSDENLSDKLKTLKSKKTKSGLFQTTQQVKVNTENPSSSSDDSNEKDKYSVTYKSSKSGISEGPKDMGATSIVEIDTQHDRDASAIIKRAWKVHNESNKDEPDNHIYQGLNNYQDFVPKKDSVVANASSGKSRYGPQRAPANIRATSRWDYQPDICKDYKETGTCGFGDSCKFMHDRSDYKFGWQLEREMEQGTYGKGDHRDYEISSGDEAVDLPFKCYMCRKSFQVPVVTKCQHYFCEKCFLNNHTKSPTCFVCNKPTGGYAKPALDVITMLEKKLQACPE